MPIVRGLQVVYATYICTRPFVASAPLGHCPLLKFLEITSRPLPGHNRADEAVHLRILCMGSRTPATKIEPLLAYGRAQLPLASNYNSDWRLSAAQIRCARLLEASRRTLAGVTPHPDNG